MTIRCACKATDAYDCWSRRYLCVEFEESGDTSFIDADGGPCECACHDRDPDDDQDWP